MLSFIDISGHLYSKSSQEKYIVAAAVSIRKRSIGNITRAMHNLKRDVLNNETLEIKSTSFTNRDALSDPQKNKYRFVSQLFTECIDVADCYYSAVIIKNEDINIRFPRERLSLHYIYLLQRIQNIARRNFCDALVLIDNENRRVDKWAAYAFNNYLYRTDSGRALDKILEVPIFADSEMTMGIQLADLVAGVLKRFYTEGLHNSDESQELYHRKLQEFYNIIYQRAPSINGLAGLYVAPDDFLSRYYT